MSLGKCTMCNGDAKALYPLLPGSPAFCAEHYNSHDAGQFGVDFSGPDDFDIPYPYKDVYLVFKPPYDRLESTWMDQTGKIQKLGELSDSHLLNICGWIVRNATDPRFDQVVGAEEALYAVASEMQRRLLWRQE